ncbi:MAG TPA: hypothetical protein VKE41_25310 [Roseiflexaceae bacterium]|nr:hypothetical protein [Roseiflexaceae bacterium]
MTNQELDHTMRQRLLECWLPLAQELNERYGWGHDARTLEALLLAAAPALRQVHSAVEAHAILWYHDLVQQARQP